MPKVAAETFRRWFARRPRPDWKPGRQPVVLLPDTFNNYLQPEVDRAMVAVLEAANFEVLVPPSVVCCGRPLFDYGMLGIARRLHARLLDTLRPMIRAGVPVVVAEPSCCASLRDELGELAGSWGYETDKYELSMAIGEQVLFPTVRAADRATVVVADGFSCRTQIAHGTGRRAVHLAQLIEGYL